VSTSSTVNDKNDHIVALKPKLRAFNPPRIVADNP